MTDILYENLTRDQADTYGLVLTSSGLPFTIRRSGRGWEIWVDASIRVRAQTLIEQYIEENKHIPQTDEQETQTVEKTFTAVWVALLLLLGHAAANMSAGIDKIARKYGSSAFDILNGEVYRSVTSLMLHSDFLHLAGNIAGIAIFGTAVCNITGAGVGWLLILLTGMLGNLANATLFKYGHISIGASTAVFGAVGILAAYQFSKKIKLATPRMKAWLPLAGGLALLGFLGTGDRSDLTAHLFGFIAGICIGLVYAMYLYRHLEKRHQIYCVAITIFIVGISWLGALWNFS
jgi:membrane associated rhomboid family serine protease